MSKEYFIGLMSGTSLDGCDAALVSFSENGIALEGFHTLDMPEGLREQVQDACSPQRSQVALICSLNVSLARFFARAAKELLEKTGHAPKDISALGSHGQTVWHNPHEKDGLPSATLQLGEPAVIAYETGIPVISNFRAMDMAAGGQGAPLVPYADYLLYKGPKPLALQNLGGIGNVTLLKANARPEDVLAFDTGPGNLILDGFAKTLFQLPYDRGGELAARGKVIEPLFKHWMALPFIEAAPPKSTGREDFGEAFIQAQLEQNQDASPHDLMRTAAEFTAHSMRRNYELYVFPRCPDLDTIVLSGGGAHNTFLRGLIARNFTGCAIKTQEDLGFSSDAKEAMAFAILARESFYRRPGNLPSATGARQALPLGSLTWPPA